jgi:hypothetical protein
MSLLGVLLRRGGLTAVVALLCGLPATARAGVSWSGPLFLNDLAPSSMSAVSCPSSSQCTAVDYRGMEATFDPAAPIGWSAYVVDSVPLDDVSCPTVGECVAVDDRGREVTFDPREASSPRSHAIDLGKTLQSISCPSVSQCTTSDSSGAVVTFDPAAPGGWVARSFSSSELAGISCPTIAQCTVIDTGYSATGVPEGARRLITFDPDAPAAGSRAVELPTLQDEVACPSSTECVALATPTPCPASCEQGATATLDPTSAQNPSIIARSQTYYVSLACSSATHCTAMDASGQEVTFDPSTPSVISMASIDPFGDWPKGLNKGEIACPSISECAVVTGTPGGYEMTFNPLAPGGSSPVPVDDGAPAIAVDCPTAHECVTVARVLGEYLPGPVGVTVTVDPRSGSSQTGPSVYAGNPAGLSCPTRAQCTVVTRRGSDCPGCYVTAGGKETTFNPMRRTSAPTGPGFRIDRASLTAVSCPLAIECVATDIRGYAISFDPRNHRHGRLRQRVAAGDLTAISCTSASTCVAVDRVGQAITFSPRATRAPVRTRIDAHLAMTALACPAASQCTATDAAGYQITFNPRTGQRVGRTKVDRHRLNAIACSSTRRCAAVDGSKGVLLGNPRSSYSWNRTALAGASDLRDIASRPHGNYVVVDAAGHAYVSHG